MGFKFSFMKNGCAHVVLAQNYVDLESAAALAISVKGLTGEEVLTAATRAALLAGGLFGESKTVASGICMEEITEREMEQWKRVFSGIS